MSRNLISARRLGVAALSSLVAVTATAGFSALTTSASAADRSGPQQQRTVLSAAQTLTQRTLSPAQP
jgi:hypothetical protein